MRKPRSQHLSDRSLPSANGYSVDGRVFFGPKGALNLTNTVNTHGFLLGADTFGPGIPDFETARDGRVRGRQKRQYKGLLPRNRNRKPQSRLQASRTSAFRAHECRAFANVTQQYRSIGCPNPARQTLAVGELSLLRNLFKAGSCTVIAVGKRQKACAVFPQLDGTDVIFIATT